MAALNINFDATDDVEFKNFHNYFHKIFTKILTINGLYNKDEKIKKNFTFSIPKIKKIIKSKNYNIMFVSDNIHMINAVKTSIPHYFANVNVKEINYLVENISLIVENFTFKLTKNIADKYNISLKNHKGKEINSIDFDANKYNIDILKELIEIQIYNNYTKENILPCNKKSTSGKEYFSFIDKIKLIKSHYRIIKNNIYVQCFDIQITLNKNPLATKIGNYMLNNGIGAKNSFGFGFVKNNVQRELKND